MQTERFQVSSPIRQPRATFDAIPNFLIIRGGETVRSAIARISALCAALTSKFLIKKRAGSDRRIGIVLAGPQTGCFVGWTGVELYKGECFISFFRQGCIALKKKRGESVEHAFGYCLIQRRCNAKQWSCSLEY